MVLVFGFLTGTFKITKILKAKKNNNPHHGCQHEPHRKGVHRVIMKLMSERYDLLNQMIDDQVDSFVSAYELFMQTYLSHYLLAKKTITGTIKGLMQDHDVHDYDHVLARIGTHAEKHFRKIMQRNHLLEKTPKEFDYFTKDEVRNIMRIIQKYLNLFYYTYSEPGGPELYEHNQTIHNEIQEIFESLFKDARDIAQHYNMRRTEIEGKLEEF